MEAAAGSDGDIHKENEAEEAPADDEPEDDIVDEASKESFPASDAPPWPSGGPERPPAA